VSDNVAFDARRRAVSHGVDDDDDDDDDDVSASEALLVKGFMSSCGDTRATYSCVRARVCGC
jgi:hypothetical protein